MPCKNLSFLVVEDHEFQRRGLVQLLASLGATAVHGAQDGEAALKLIADASQPVDIVICDVNMPGMDGMEFVRRWSERGDPSSLILMSAIEPELLGTVANMALAYKVRLLGVTSKPATAAKLTPLIELHRSQQRLPLPKDHSFSFDEITAAWVGEEFECWFEPRINLATGAPRAMAAVPRWRHLAEGVLEADAFMPSIRARALDDSFTCLHVQQAAAACRRWQLKCEGIPVSVNLGFHSLADVNLSPRIHHILQREGLDPRLMILSVNEAALDTNQLAQVLENLARLRLLGFGLAISDFGMGPTALDPLALAAFTELHIPSRFVVGSDRDPSARAGLAVALEAAQQLKVPAVATGIASKYEWTQLHEWGCRFGQGPFIAPPMSRSAVPRWLANRQNAELSEA
ncbi:EAL domain-containing response regulator [Ramlibacter sp. PS3R-8]|uniref:EAL domain-containing response regulator n=1 Tax=Ramlibacter sp. PS3R-8 TaxID=3133437 RepID=UPI0030996D58